MVEKKGNEVAQNLVESFREINQAVVQSIIDAQQRNMKFAQNTFTNAFEALKSHAEATNGLMQQLEQLTQKQQEAFQKLVQGRGETPLIENYTDSLSDMLSSYLRALEGAEKATQQGIERFEKAVEDFEKAAQRPVSAASRQAGS
jgi:hypothetical protein